MTTLAQAITAYFSPSDLARLTELQPTLIEDVISQALDKLSEDKPREAVLDVGLASATTGFLNLPPDWERRWSNIVSIEYPIEGVVIGEQPTNNEGGTRYQAAVGESVLVGQVVRLSNSFVHLAAANQSSYAAVGVVIQVDSNTAIFTSDGTVTLNDWSAVTGSELLIPNERYFLQTAAGMLGVAPPNDAPVVTVGRAINEYALDIEIEIVL